MRHHIYDKQTKNEDFGETIQHLMDLIRDQQLKQHNLMTTLINYTLTTHGKDRDGHYNLISS